MNTTEIVPRNIFQQLSERLARPPKICLLSYSIIADDPRVRRQGDAFADAGWHVFAISLPGAREQPPRWPIWTWDNGEAVVCLDGSLELADSSPATSVAEAAPPVGAGVDVIERGVDIPKASSSFQGSLKEHYRRSLLPVFLRATYIVALYRVLRIGPKRLPANVKRAGRYYVALKNSHVLQSRLNPKKCLELYLQSQRDSTLLSNRKSSKRFDVYIANDWHMLPRCYEALRRVRRAILLRHP